MRFNNEDYLKAYPRQTKVDTPKPESAIDTFKSTEETESEQAVEEFTQVNSEMEGDADGTGNNSESDIEQ